MCEHSSICGRIKSTSLTLSVKEQPWTRSSRLLETLGPPTAGNASMCGAESMCVLLQAAPGCWHTAPPSESGSQERASVNPSGEAAPRGATSAYLPPHTPAEPPQPAGDGQHALLLHAVSAETAFSLWPCTALLRKVTGTQGSLCEVEEWGQPLALVCTLRKD